MEATENFLKNVLHNMRVKGLTELRQIVRKPKAVSEASSVQGKFRGNHHLNPSVCRYSFTLGSCTGERGRRK